MKPCKCLCFLKDSDASSHTELPMRSSTSVVFPGNTRGSSIRFATNSRSGRCWTNLQWQSCDYVYFQETLHPIRSREIFLLAKLQGCQMGLIHSIWKTKRAVLYAPVRCVQTMYKNKQALLQICGLEPTFWYCILGPLPRIWYLVRKVSVSAKQFWQKQKDLNG